MGHIRNGHRNLVVIPDGKDILRVPRSRRVDLKDIAFDIIDCIHHVHCQTLVSTVRYSQVQYHGFLK